MALNPAVPRARASVAAHRTHGKELAARPLKTETHALAALRGEKRRFHNALRSPRRVLFGRPIEIQFGVGIEDKLVDKFQP